MRKTVATPPYSTMRASTVRILICCRRAPRNILFFTILLAACSVFLRIFVGAAAVQAPQDSHALLGAKYADPLPEQKMLVDDWFRRFSEVVKKNVSPQEGDDNLPQRVDT